MAGGLGLCGKSPRKLALRGTEVLPCWEAMPVREEGPSVREAGVGPRGREERAPRTFVPVEELRGRPSETAVATAPPGGPGTSTARWSLWGDPDA